MGTSLAVKDQNKSLSQAELLARLQVSMDESQTVNSKFLNFDGRVGRITVPNGTDEPDTFAPDQQMYLSIWETKKSYVCWKGGQVIDSKEYSMFEPLPPVSQMEDHGPYSDNPQDREGWKLQYIVFLKLKSDGKQYQLKLSSTSATRAFGAFIGELLEEGRLHDFKEETPLIQLGVESFKHQGHKNYKPKFKIMAWEANPKEEAQAAVTDASADKPSEEGATDAKAAMPASRKK